MSPRATTAAAAALAVAAAATAIHGLFAGWSWYPPVLGGIALVALAGLAGRWWRVPGALLAGLRLVLLVEYAVLLDARHRAFADVVPTPGAIAALGHAVSLAASDIRVLIVPVAVRPELTLVAVGAVFVIAMAVDDLAAARRPALAGVALLPLLVVPAGIHDTRVGVAPFTAGAAGWLVLLALDGRGGALAAGSRERGSLNRARGERARARGERSPAAGWRVGATALAVAALVPLALPTLHHNFLADGPGNGSGDNVVTVVPPLVTVDKELHQKQTTDLLTVHTATPTYLRLTTLEAFNGVSFTLGPISAPASQEVGHGLAPTPGRVDSRTVRVTVSGDANLAENYLPLPYSPVSVHVDGDWRLDLGTRTVFSTTTTTRGLTYSATSAVADPDTAQLAATGPPAPETGLTRELLRDTYVPSYELAALRLIAGDVTRGATTAFQEALDIQSYLRRAPFTYNLNVAPLSSPLALETFLDSSHTGYCQQFAVAMAALARAIGLPARVAVGFTPGTRTGPDTYTVTNHDAHAWPEIWFPNTGWLRFEPTPSARTQPPNYPAGATPAPGTHGGSHPAHHHHTTTSPAGAHPHPRTKLPQSGTPAVRHPVRHRARRAASTWPLALLSVAGLVLLLALAPGGARLARRRRRLAAVGRGGPQGALAAWTEVLDGAEDLRITLPAGASPRAVGRLLLAAAPDGRPEVAPALSRLVGGVERAVYAPPEATGSTPPTREDVTAVIRALVVAADPRHRWWARVAPVSVLRSAAAGLRPVIGVAADAVDRVDGAIGAVGRRLTGPGSAR